MDKEGSFFLQEIKIEIKKNRIRKSIEKVEKFFYTHHNINQMHIDDLLQILYLEVYASSKLLYLRIANCKQNGQPELHKILQIMHRNVAISNKILETFIHSLFIIKTSTIGAEKPTLRRKSSEKVFNYFFQSYLIFCKTLCFYYEKKNWSCLKFAVLLEAIEFVEKIDFKGKVNIKIQVLTLQIKCLFSRYLHENGKHNHALFVLQDLSFNLEIISKLEKRSWEKKDYKLKRCVNILYLSLTSMIKIHILTDKMNPVLILQGMVNRIAKDAKMRKIIKQFLVLNEEMNEVINSYYHYHPEICKIIETMVPEVLCLQKKREKKSSNNYGREEGKKYERQMKILKSQVYKLTYETINTVIPFNLINLAKKKRTKLIKEPSQNRVSIYDHQDLQENRNISKEIMNFTNEFRSSSEHIKRKKVCFRNGKQKVRKSYDHFIYTDKEKVFQQMKNYHLKNLKEKRRRKNINLDQSSKQSYFDVEDIEKKGFKMKVIDEFRSSFEKEKEKKRKKGNQNEKKEEPVLRFINLLIKNKQNLSLYSYANRMNTYLEKEKKNQQIQSKKKILHDRLSLHLFEGTKKKVSFCRINERKRYEKGGNLSKEEKRELCFKRGRQSVLEISKKLETTSFSKKIFRKSLAYFDNDN